MDAEAGAADEAAGESKAAEQLGQAGDQRNDPCLA